MTPGQAAAELRELKPGYEHGLGESRRYLASKKGDTELEEHARWMIQNDEARIDALALAIEILEEHATRGD